MEKRSFLFVCALSLSFFFINNYLFDQKTPPTEAVSALKKEEPSLDVKPLLVSNNSSANEVFYVLENEYQQIVFSTKGGAIAEINLPFSSKINQKSVVLPIQFDTTIEEKNAPNAKFPLNSYKTFENGEIVTKDPKLGGYTPLLRRTLKNEDGSIISELSSEYYAFNIVSNKPLDETSSSRISRMGEDFIEFVSESNGHKITKTYTIPKNTPYTFELEVKVEGDAGDLWVTSGVLEVELVSGSFSPLLQYYTVDGKGKKTIEKIKLPKVDTTLKTVNALWASNANGFFGMIIDPVDGPTAQLKVKSISGDAVPSRLTLIDREYDLYPAKDYPAYQILIPYKKESTNQKFISYSGPYSSKVLDSVDVALSNPKTGIGENPNFSKVVVIQGWITFITEPFSRFLYILMQFFFMITKSWGISIILLTLALRIMIYPLNAWAYKSTAKMQNLSPKLAALQEKFKSDQKRLHTETAMLYKTEGVNPFSGCLPMLIQFPFLIGMFDLLKSTFELRGVDFIPGWIENLTAPDVLFSWHYPIVFIGTNFHLLPFILGGLMYLQAKIGAMQQNQKGPLTEQQQQLKTAGNVMTIVFTFMFYNMPSGLNIYWIFSTIFGMLQQWFMIRRFQNNPKILKKS
jgi:YidC/Oxa1 family membrane protein insertase